jgi:hypothetical protein
VLWVCLIWAGVLLSHVFVGPVYFLHCTYFALSPATLVLWCPSEWCKTRVLSHRFPELSCVFLSLMPLLFISSLLEPLGRYSLLWVSFCVFVVPFVGSDVLLQLWSRSSVLIGWRTYVGYFCCPCMCSLVCLLCCLCFSFLVSFSCILCVMLRDSRPPSCR